MRLGIISDSRHFYGHDGRLYNHNPILARQIDYLASLFETTTICAPLLRETSPDSAAAYSAKSISLEPVRWAGGNTIKAKLELLAQIPSWWMATRRLLKKVDAVHIRCPNNISIVGLVALTNSSVNRQALYTGAWSAYDGEPVTYSWQRWYLKNVFGGPVAVYGNFQEPMSNIIPTFSPSYSDVDWTSEAEQVQERIHDVATGELLTRTIRISTVGSLSPNKNQQFVIRVLAALHRRGYAATLNIIGEGPESTRLHALSQKLGVSNHIRFFGHIPHEDVRCQYRQSDFIIQAPHAEGYGKVPIESFFHGAIPILSDVNLSQQLIGEGARGRCFTPGDVDGAADAVEELVQSPSEASRLIANGRDYARGRTLEAWRDHLKKIFDAHWTASPGSSTDPTGFHA